MDRVVDWLSWRTNIDQAVADDGRAIILCDDEGLPLKLLSVLDVDAPDTNLNADTLKLKLPAAVGNEPHPLVDLLIADGLGKQDAETTALEPVMDSTHMIVVQGPGGWMDRTTYTVDVPSVDGDDDGPLVLEVEGTKLVDLLDWHPCPSVPGSWEADSWEEWATDASGGTYEKTRVLAPTQHGTVAYGHTSKGPVLTTIRRVVQDSLDAVNTLYGYDRPHLVTAYPAGVDDSREALIRRDDRTIWETISETARIHGVNVDVKLWWPGDPAVQTRSGRWDADYPVGVVTVEKIGD